MNITQNLDFDMLFKSEWRKLKTFKISADVSKKTAEKVFFSFLPLKSTLFQPLPVFRWWFFFNFCVEQLKMIKN